MKNFKKSGLSCQLSLSQTYGFQKIHIYKAKVTYLSYKTMLPPKLQCKQLYPKSSRLFKEVFRHVFKIVNNIRIIFESGGEVNLICEYYMHRYFYNIRLKLSTCKLQNEVETKRNKTQRNRNLPKQNEIYRNETYQNETKQNEIKTKQNLPTRNYQTIFEIIKGYI